ncbi:MAG TPA: hypothetical protein VL625_11060 [Patescibacteria group bacterium]|nr:hypothetical protein [Patescibacteria group bacterium]
MRIIKSAILAVALLVTAGTAAKADYFVWRDAKSGMSLSFPDTWKIVTNQKPHDVVTIMAPSGRAHAACKVSVSSERRFLIYPPRFGADVQELNFNADFWDQYFKMYDDDMERQTMDDAGLGRGWAGFTEAQYQTAVPGPWMAKRGIAFATNYFDKLYVLDCSSHRDAFADWKGAFLDIAHSIDFFPAYHQLMTGNYRNFMHEPRLDFPDIKLRYRDQY